MSRGCAVVALLAACATSGCGAEPGAESEPTNVKRNEISPPAATFPSTYARQWMTALALSSKYDVISPPVAARTYSYGAVALYESIVHGMPGYRSLAGQLNGLDSLPLPDPNLEYDWPVVLAQTMTRITRRDPADGVAAIYAYPNRIFYEFTTPAQASLDSLGNEQIGFRRASGVPEDVIQNSIEFADQLADALIAWTRSDGYYDVRYKGWIPPKGPDKWVPTGFSDTDKVANPLEPHFASVRPMVLTDAAECEPLAAPPPFSTDPSSDMYQEAKAVYDTEVSLTDQQREIANFWADGPGATPTPSGHWLAIATKFLRTRNLAEAAAGYAFTQLGHLDSFITIWYGKYKYNLLRPETYIRRHINPTWRPLLPSPPFPSYMSGHSGQSAAAASLMTEWFGDIPFVDDTKLRRGFGAFSYASFMDAAQEAADSRIYGGIHYPMDDFLDQGVCVGDAIKSRIDMTL